MPLYIGEVSKGTQKRQAIAILNLGMKAALRE
jgi:hypothetical protein